MHHNDLLTSCLLYNNFYYYSLGTGRNWFGIPARSRTKTANCFSFVLVVVLSVVDSSQTMFLDGIDLACPHRARTTAAAAAKRVQNDG